MKKLISLTAAVFILILFQTSITSCSKTETVTVTDTVTIIQPDNSIANLLMRKQWIVDSLYHDYTSSNPTNLGTLVYKRGASNNAQNLDNYVVLFWPDGDQLFINGASSSYVVYPYHFLGSDSVNFVVNNPQPDYARIVTLDASHLTIYDSTNSALSFYRYKP